MPFTDRQIAALKPKTERYEVKEPGRTGLGVRVTPRGEKSWTFMYRFAGKQKRMTLGGYPTLSLSRAHKALADAKDILHEATAALAGECGALVCDDGDVAHAAPCSRSSNPDGAMSCSCLSVSPTTASRTSVDPFPNSLRGNSPD